MTPALNSRNLTVFTAGWCRGRNSELRPLSIKTTKEAPAVASNVRYASLVGGFNVSKPVCRLLPCLPLVSEVTSFSILLFICASV